MRKLNKTIKRYTDNKQRRKKKNIEVFEYLSDLISFTEMNQELKLEQFYFEQIRKYVFLEKYFEDEMIENKVNIVDYLFEYFDYDLFSLTDEKIRSIYLDLKDPDNFARNRIKLICLRVPIIGKILKDPYL